MVQFFLTIFFLQLYVDLLRETGGGSHWSPKRGKLLEKNDVISEGSIFSYVYSKNA